MGVRAYYLLVLFQMVITTGFTQLTIADIERKYSVYHSLWKPALIWPVLNQTKYSPGDTIYFKTYHVWDDYRLIKGKQLVEANLIDHNGKSLSKINFIAQDGLAYNQVFIPNTLEEGIYRLTFHTSLSKNSQPAQIGSQIITIVKQNKIVEDVKITASVEGGFLTHELEGQVVIKSKPRSKLSIQNQTGEKIKALETDNYGWAALTFIPSIENRYSIVSENTHEVVQLPVVQKEGLAIRIVSTEQNTRELKIILTHTLVESKQPIFFVATQAGKIIDVKMMNDMKPELTVPLPHASGIGPVTLNILSSAGQVLGYRTYTPEEINRPHVKLQFDPDPFTPRSQVNTLVKVSDTNGHSSVSEFSFTVLNGNLSDSLQLASPQLPLNKLQHLGPHYSDLHLILEPTFIPWEKIIHDTHSKPPYILLSQIERKGIVLSNNKPVPENTQVLVYLQKNQYFLQTLAGKNGEINLVLPDFYGEDYFFYMAKSTDGEMLPIISVNWQIDNVELPPAPPSITLQERDLLSEFTYNSRAIEQSYKSFTQTTPPSELSLSSEWRLAIPDLTVNVQDYELFTMAELIKEVIPAIYHRKRQDQDVVRVKLQAPMPVASSAPLYVIDGVVMEDSKMFMNLDLKDLKTISVITQPKKLIPLGLMGKNGIVIVNSIKGNLIAPTTSNQIEGLSKAIMLSSKDGNPSVPTFRSRVYWKPITITNAAGEGSISFYTTNDLGPLSLTTEGITSDGQQFYKSEIIYVNQIK